MDGITFDSLTRRSAHVSRRKVLGNVAAVLLSPIAALINWPGLRPSGAATTSAHVPSSMPGLSCDDCISLCEDAKPFVEVGNEVGCRELFKRGVRCKSGIVVCELAAGIICVAVTLGAGKVGPDCKEICRGIDLPGVDPVCKGDKIYTSPHYGYTVTYDPEVYSIQSKADSTPDDEVDFVIFSFLNDRSSIGVSGVALDEPDDEQLRQCVENNEDMTSNTAHVSNFRQTQATQSNTVPQARGWGKYAFTWTGDDGSLEAYLRYKECRWLGNGTVAVIVHHSPATSSNDAEALQQALIDGIRPQDPAIYKSPHHGFTITYDPFEWSRNWSSDENSDDDDDRVDFLRKNSSIVLHGRIAYAQDQMATCAYNTCRWFNDPSAVSNLQSVTKPNAEGSTQDRAWTAVTLAYQENDQVTDYYGYCECRWLGEGLNLNIAHWMTTDHIETEAQARVKLMAGFKPK